MRRKSGGINFPGTKREGKGFPGGSVVKNPPASAGHQRSAPDLGRFHTPQSS